MKRPKLPLSITLPMGVFARKLGMTLDEYLAIAFEEVEQPPGWEESFAAAFAPLPDGLTSEHRHNTVPDVTPAPSSNALRSQARISDDSKKHRLVAVLAKKGITFAEVADALEQRLKPRKFPRSTVQSWVKPKGDASYRAIPQDAAEALKALYGVPLSAWPRIIPG